MDRECQYHLPLILLVFFFIKAFDHKPSGETRRNDCDISNNSVNFGEIGGHNSELSGETRHDSHDREVRKLSGFTRRIWGYLVHIDNNTTYIDQY
jgi:hypothetical protein